MEKKLYPTTESEMKELTLYQQKYLSLAELFLWAEGLDFTEWILGTRTRWKRTEYTLPRLVRGGKLRTVRHGKKLVYTASKKASTQHIDHGLACTRALLRFKKSKKGVYVAESYFKRHGYKSIPEWGIVYPNGTLLFEYTTADNFRRVKAMNRKVDVYRKEVKKFQGVFDKPFYLFVIEAPRYEVKRFAEKLDGHFYAVDASSFFNVTKKEQLTTPIYIWGGDGQTYPLD